jgi:hypothetical protein
VTVEPVSAVPRPVGVSVWDRKKVERHPEAEVKLSDDLWMPAAADLDSIVDLEDWIREAERQIEDDAEVSRIFIVPMATALMAGGVLGVVGGLAVAGWSGVVLGFLLALAAALEPLLHRNMHRDRNRRVDAYRKRLRGLRIPPNIEPEARPTPS